jgi:hypothetical protein
MTEESAVLRVWRQYLLGELSEAEQDKLEVDLLSTDTAAPELADAEDGLIEEYLDGALSAAQRRRFEEYFLLSPEHRRSLEAAGLLREALTRLAVAPSRPRRPLVGAWAGLLAAAIAFIVFNLYRKAEAPPLPPRAVAVGPTATSAVRQEPMRVALLSLSPGRVMAAGSETRIGLGAGVGTLRLELIVEDPSLTRARVVVSARDHGDVWTGTAAPARVDGGAVLTVDVPAERLHGGSSYEVAVLREPDGVKSGIYYFTVDPR